MLEMIKYGRTGRLGIVPSWTVEDALKMCLSNNYDGAIKVYGPHFKPSHAEFTWMTRVNCHENATSLDDCLENI